METFQQGQQAYIADTRGNPKDYYGSHLAVFGLTGQEINQLKLPIHYASNKLSREDFTVKYPELAMSENGRWRKAFSEEGNLLFIHRGRGTTFARRHDRSNKHDDFVTLVREFNQKSKHASH